MFLSKKVALSVTAFIASAGILLFSAAASHAQTTLFNDTFADNNPLRTSSLDMNWYYLTTGTFGTVANGSDYALRYAPGTTFGAMVGVFDTGTGVVLGSTVGDYLQLSLDYSLGTLPASSSVRIGLYNSGGTTITNSGYPAAAASDFGYRVDTQYAGGAPVLQRETGADASTPGGGGDATALSTGTSAAALITGNTYSLTLRLTRTLSGITTNATLLNGGTTVYSFSGADTGGVYSSFNEVVIAAGGGGTSSTPLPNSFTVDNVTLTQAIAGAAAPEPASLGLLAFGAIPLTNQWMARRRKKERSRYDSAS